MDLNYYLELMSLQEADDPGFAARFWDDRAKFWERERKAVRKDDERVASALEYLKRKGILDGSCAVADIGCGPGRFAVAFAQNAGSVLGLDISREMTAQGAAHAAELGLTNCRFRACDFAALSPEAEGYLGAFDLVFASLTPAVHSMESLRKMMSMSRGYCMNISHLSRENHLRRWLLQEVFGRESEDRHSGRWFYALFNALLLMGYQPETSYQTRRKEVRQVPGPDYANYLMSLLLPQQERTEENAGKILTWLQAHKDPDGTILEASDAVFGRILWDVRRGGAGGGL